MTSSRTLGAVVIAAVGAAVIIVCAVCAHPPAAPPPAPEDDCLEIAGLSFRVCPTSWYRTAAHNEAVGGAAHSNHILGCAIDWIPQSRELRQVLQLHAWAARTLSGAWIEPLTESSSHVHTDWRCHERVG